MQRLIDADAFKKENERLLHCDFPYLSETTLEELIDEAPTIDAEPVKHGKWKQNEIVQECFDIDGNKTWGIKYMCESCGFKTIAIEGHFAQYKYCPPCGARMDKE